MRSRVLSSCFGSDSCHDRRSLLWQPHNKDRHGVLLPEKRWRLFWEFAAFVGNSIAFLFIGFRTDIVYLSQTDWFDRCCTFGSDSRKSRVRLSHTCISPQIRTEDSLQMDERGDARRNEGSSFYRPRSFNYGLSLHFAERHRNYLHHGSRRRIHFHRLAVYITLQIHQKELPRRAGSASRRP